MIAVEVSLIRWLHGGAIDVRYLVAHLARGLRQEDWRLLVHAWPRHGRVLPKELLPVVEHDGACLLLEHHAELILGSKHALTDLQRVALHLVQVENQLDRNAPPRRDAAQRITR